MAQWLLDRFPWSRGRLQAAHTHLLPWRTSRQSPWRQRSAGGFQEHSQHLSRHCQSRLRPGKGPSAKGKD
eukprot:10604489-Prorocentrum_lima.AAC.1